MPANELYFGKPICEEFRAFSFRAALVGNCITVFLVGWNFILSFVVIALISWVGLDTHSKRLTFVTNGVFLSQFFNTGIVVLLV